MAHAVNRNPPGDGGAVVASPAGVADAEGVSGGDGDNGDGPGEDGGGDGEDGVAVAVTDALGVTVAGVAVTGATLAAGRELDARYAGEAGVVAGCVRAGVTFRPVGTSAGALVPWPLSPPGVVAMTDGACSG